jgi:hypothetical protein
VTAQIIPFRQALVGDRQSTAPSVRCAKLALDVETVLLSATDPSEYGYRVGPARCRYFYFDTDQR